MTVNKIPSRYNYKTDNLLMCKDLDSLITNYKLTMLNRCMQMVDIEGLPPTIPKKDLLFILFTNGSATIYEVGGQLYAFSSNLGGILNEYYLPTKSIVTNPYLKVNKTLEVDKECVVILNDSMYMGLVPMFEKYAGLLANIDISIYWAVINSRTPKVFETDNDSIKEGFTNFFTHLEKGDKIESVAGSVFIDGLKAYEFNGQADNTIQNLIEAKQYITAQWFQELGLNANYNMKRESLNENEINADTDVLKPFIDDIIEQYEIGFKKVNLMYGTNITVKKASAWADVEKYDQEQEPEPEQKQEGEKDEANRDS